MFILNAQMHVSIALFMLQLFRLKRYDLTAGQKRADYTKDFMDAGRTIRPGWVCMSGQ